VCGELQDFLACEFYAVAHHLDTEPPFEPREVPRGFSPDENGRDLSAKGEFLTPTAQGHHPWKLGSIGGSFADPELSR